MRINIMGPKSSGKSVTGKAFAEQAGVEFIDLDDVIIERFFQDRSGGGGIGDVYRQVGPEGFAELELAALDSLENKDWYVLSVGGSTPLRPAARNLLRKNGIMVLFTADFEVLWRRTCARGRMPAYLEDEDDPKGAFRQRVERLLDVITPYADVVIDKSELSLDEAVRSMREAIINEMHLRMQSPNTLGQIVRVTTFGESHGPAVGAVLDGLPPGIEISEADMQKEMDRRRPGQSKVSTSRQESDKLEILSGVFEGQTTGAPIAMLVRNKDQRPGHYESLREVFRPGHADFAFFHKFGHRDHRGGGRSSGRETAARVAAGGVARQRLSQLGVKIHAFAEEIGGVRGHEVDLSAVEQNPVRAADPAAAKAMEERILQAQKEKDSVGGLVQLRILGLRKGVGDPVFFKLDARLTMAMMTIGAVKGVEIGSGFAAAGLTGSRQNDQMRDGQFVSNSAGGILGGISTGQEIVMRLAVKPTPSIAQAQATVDQQGRNVEIEIGGRHDPCIVPRLVPVAEAMAALVVLDALQVQDRLEGS